MNFGAWISSITKPAETFKAEKANASIGAGIFNYAIVYIIIGFIIGITVAIFGITTTYAGMSASNSLLMPWQGFGKFLGLGAIILIPVIFAFGITIGSLILHGILYIFAKLLKGQGTFTQQYYLNSLYIPVITLISFVVMFVPLIGFFLSWIVSLFSLYLLTIAFRETHNYSTGRAVLTWLMPLIIIFIIIVAIVVFAVMIFLINPAQIGTVTPMT